ncbi:hypothetical protein Tco_0047780 [Tanacetum coccineum]
MELEKVVKERDELKVKIEKWEESSKGLNKILNSQMSAKDKNVQIDLCYQLIFASASSSSEYSWSESRLKSGDLNSSRLRVLKCLLNDRNSRSASVPDDRYAVSNRSGYAVLICSDEYAVLDKKLDTLYPMEVDTPYSTIDQNSMLFDVINEDEEEEEEEHPASADSVPPPVHRVTARMFVRAQTPISLPSDTEVARLLAIPTPPPSPLSLLSSPLPPILSPLPQILSPPLPVSSPPLPASPTYPLGYSAAMIRLRAETPSASHTLPSSIPPSGTPPLLPIPLPTLLPPLLLLFTVCRAGVSEVTLPPQKRLCIALGPRYEVGESSSAPTARPTGGFRADYEFVGTLDDEIRRDPERYVSYGITNTWDDMVEDMHGTPAVTDVAELSQRMTDFVTTVRQDTYEIYGRLDDAQDDRLLMTERLNMLYRDRHAHARTARLMETEARLSREAWVQSMDASDTARSEVRALRTAVLAQQTKIAGLRKMTPKGTTRANPAATTATTSVTNEQLKALIDQGVANALAARDTDRSRNGEDSHDSGTGIRRQAPSARECTYPDFM